MLMPNSLKWLVISLVFHFSVLLFFILSYSFSSTIFVIKNTNQHDIISAVILGDTPKSNIVTTPASSVITPTPENQVKKEKPMMKNEAVIAVSKEEKKKKVDAPAKIKHDLIAKDLLADIQKMNEKQKKIQQKKLKSHFEKSLHEQAEESLRQQLLKEKIKLQAKEEREAQGIVNKYKALILQAISENWIVPSHVDKKLSCAVMIRLAPGGSVLDVQVTRGSGDPSLDSSIRAAILKASPLPVPSDSHAFEMFRQFILKVKPENILKA